MKKPIVSSWNFSLKSSQTYLQGLQEEFDKRIERLTQKLIFNVYDTKWTDDSTNKGSSIFGFRIKRSLSGELR